MSFPLIPNRFCAPLLWFFSCIVIIYFSTFPDKSNIQDWAMSKFINISAPRRLKLELHICKEPLRAVRERSRKYVRNRTSKTNKQKHQRHYQGCSSHILASPNGIAIHIATFISRSLKQGTLGSFLVSTWFIYYHHSLKFSGKKKIVLIQQSQQWNFNSFFWKPVCIFNCPRKDGWVLQTHS